MTLNLLANFLKLHDEFDMRARIRTSLVDWATDILRPSGLVPSTHQRLLLNHLDLITSGDIKRLMVLMPPGSAKSTYASVLFPIWWLIRHPASSIIAVSHSAALVEHFSRRIHAMIEDNPRKTGIRLRKDDRSASHWKTEEGGDYFGTGMRGGITGRRADLIIIDDPIKSMRESDSERHRRQTWEWYTSELTTRLKPEARIVLVMTRWHEQDLGGQLLARDTGEWRVLRLPAIAEECDPMGRPPGAPLWPEWEGIEALRRKRELIGERSWSALFQQSPHPPGGHLFKTERLQVLKRDQSPLSAGTKAVRAWDLAATAAVDRNNPDWTVGLKLVALEGGQFLIEDIVRMQGEPRSVEEAIIATARQDGHAVIVSLPIDPGQAGKSQIARLSSILGGYRICATREQGSKLVRATPVAAQMEAGNVAVRDAHWRRSFVDELRTFPLGTKDDQVDALSRAFATLADLQNSGRRAFVPFNVR